MARLLTRDAGYYRSLAKLAIPVALQNLIVFMVTFADNLMVGSLKDGAVSGVYYGNLVQTLLQMFTAGVGGSIVIIASQYWGKQDVASIKRITAVGARAAVCVGAALTLVCALMPEKIIWLLMKDPEVVAEGAKYLGTVCYSYVFFCLTQVMLMSLRSVEITRVGFAVTLLSLSVNVLLNYILIFGKLGFEPMGVKGAAIATVISRGIELATVSVYMIFIDKRLRFKPGDLLRSGGALTKDFFRYALPVTAGELVWGVNMIASSVILGLYGEKAITTAASVANMMNALAFITISGMSTAVGIITGKTIGSGNTRLMREYAYTTQILFLALGLITGAIVHFLNAPFVSLYTSLFDTGISPEAAAEARVFIQVLVFTIIGTTYQAPCLFGLVKSGGDVNFVFINDSIFVFLIVLPSAVIAWYYGAPAWVTFMCLKSDQILKCFVAVVKINRFKWMKKLTRE